MGQVSLTPGSTSNSLSSCTWTWNHAVSWFEANLLLLCTVKAAGVIVLIQNLWAECRVKHRGHEGEFLISAYISTSHALACTVCMCVCVSRINYLQHLFSASGLLVIFRGNYKYIIYIWTWPEKNSLWILKPFFLGEMEQKRCLSII